jgi:hypothetical protein
MAEACSSGSSDSSSGSSSTDASPGSARDAGASGSRRGAGQAGPSSPLARREVFAWRRHIINSFEDSHGFEYILRVRPTLNYV